MSKSNPQGKYLYCSYRSNLRCRAHVLNKLEWISEVERLCFSVDKKINQFTVLLLFSGLICGAGRYGARREAQILGRNGYLPMTTALYLKLFNVRLRTRPLPTLKEFSAVRSTRITVLMWYPKP